MKNDILESEAFYNLMQAYRHAPISGQEKTVEAYEAVKEFIRDNYIPEEWFDKGNVSLHPRQVR